jgi:hypothetical protein
MSLAPAAKEYAITFSSLAVVIFRAAKLRTLPQQNRACSIWGGILYRIVILLDANRYSN